MPVVVVKAVIKYCCTTVATTVITVIKIETKMTVVVAVLGLVDFAVAIIATVNEEGSIES